VGAVEIWDLRRRRRVGGNGRLVEEGVDAEGFLVALRLRPAGFAFVEVGMLRVGRLRGAGLG